MPQRRLRLRDVFVGRDIGADLLPEATPTPLPLNESADAQRAASVEQNLGPVSAGVVECTNDLLVQGCVASARLCRKFIMMLEAARSSDAIMLRAPQRL